MTKKIKVKTICSLDDEKSINIIIRINLFEARLFFFIFLFLFSFFYRFNFLFICNLVIFFYLFL